MILKSLLVLLVLFFISARVFPQYSLGKVNKGDVILNYSKVHVLYSENVQDSFYIYVKLPKYYDQEINKSYPVVYLLDGDIAFPMAWSVVRYLQYGKYVPDVIIVGIGYGGLLYSSKLSKRERDYSISEFEGLTGTGGADNFLNFIREELIPYLETEYRMDPNNFTLSGHSLGGLFTLYTLFSESYLFSNYIANSPYVSNDLEKLLLLEEENNSQIEDANCKLFISYGSNEDREKYIVPKTINNIVNLLQQRGPDYINLKFRIFEEGVHFSTPAEAMTYGLLHTFK